jgi:ribosomal protein S4
MGIGVAAAGIMAGGSILGSLLQGGFSLWAQSKQEKQAAEQNRIYQKQYEQERADKLTQERWQRAFYEDREKFSEYQTNLQNIGTWGKNMENILNKDLGLKNALLNVWSSARG